MNTKMTRQFHTAQNFGLGQFAIKTLLGQSAKLEWDLLIRW